MKHDFGETVPGIDFGVFNERTVRAAAGILFIIGFFGWSIALLTENYGPLRAFGVLFMLDMFVFALVRLCTHRNIELTRL